MAETDRKKKFIIDVLYIAIILALFYVFMRFGFGLLFPFLMAFFVAICLQRPTNFLTRKTHIPRGITSAVLVILVLLVVLIIVSLIGAKIVSEFKGFFSYLMSKFEDVPAFISQIENWFKHNLTFLPESVRTTISNSVSNFLENTFTTSNTAETPNSLDISSIASPLWSVISSAKQIPSFLVAFLVSVVTCCFMTSDYPNIKEFIFRQLPEEKNEKVSKAKTIIFSFLGKMGKAYAIILSVTFVELLLGLSLLKIFKIYTGNYVFVIALLTAIIDIIPVLGTGSVLIPWALASFFTGSYALGIGILIMYAVITVVRQVMEPKLVAGQLGLPPFLTLMSMYIGSQIFGVFGIFLLPLTVITVKELNDEGIIHLYKPMPKEPTT